MSFHFAPCRSTRKARLPDEHVSSVGLLERCTMPCNNSHRYIRYQRVFLVQSVILKDPVTLYFHAGSIVHDFLIPCLGIECMTPFLLYRDLYFRQRHFTLDVKTCFSKLDGIIQLEKSARETAFGTAAKNRLGKYRFPCMILHRS